NQSEGADALGRVVRRDTRPLGAFRVRGAALARRDCAGAGVAVPAARVDRRLRIALLAVVDAPVAAGVAQRERVAEHVGVVRLARVGGGDRGGLYDQRQ